MLDPDVRAVGGRSRGLETEMEGERVIDWAVDGEGGRN